VCGFIGMQAQVDVSRHGGRNPLVDLAAAIDILHEPTEEERELERMRGPKVADRVEDDPRFGRVAADPGTGTEASNAAGSYEMFLQSFSGPPPVPGREGS
jgi:hypothetical protein